jgi:hypothetical protein
MHQLALLPEDESVNYMAQYQRDQVPMDPLVAQFLMSQPSMEVIEDMQEWMLENMPPGDTKPDNYFAEGLYARSLDIKAGMFAIGKRHTHGHLTFLMKGDLTIISDAGTERVKAPRVWVDGPGVKRAVYAHADSTVVTTHATTLTDMSELELQLTSEVTP